MLNLANLIENGDFDTWRGAIDDPPDFWTVQATPTLLREANACPGVVSDYHIKIEATLAVDEGITIVGDAFNYLRVKPSTEYTFSVYYKAENGDEAGIKIQSFNENTPGTEHINVELISEGWHRYYVQFTTDADATNLQIQLLAANSGGVVYYSGAMITEGDAVWAFTAYLVGLGFTLSTGLEWDGDAIKVKFADAAELIFGDDNDGKIYEYLGNLIIKVATEDKDLIFYVNDGGVNTEVFRLVGATGRIKLNSDIDFNEKQAIAMRIECRTTDPDTPGDGRIWLRTDL